MMHFSVSSPKSRDSTPFFFPRARHDPLNTGNLRPNTDLQLTTAIRKTTTGFQHNLAPIRNQRHVLLRRFLSEQPFR